jgi:exodeoxyribonuclease V beta subunit
VDEFQDTDPLQYRIFSSLFSQPPHLLAMIGDPKQAIYGFRGADLHSYLQAVERADDKTTLTRNWRSTPGLVKAVNTVFERSESPFGLEEISFEKAQAAVVEPDEPSPALNYGTWIPMALPRQNGQSVKPRRCR